MRWTLKQLLEHPNRDSLVLVNKKSKASATKIVDEKTRPSVAPPSHAFVVTPESFTFQCPAPAVKHCFVVPGDPMGKPRMTHRDSWKQRPVVLRYRRYCDLIRGCAGTLPPDPFYLVIHAHIAMAASWSKKKKDAQRGKLCRLKPDYDNIAKAVGDALFEEDSILGGGTCWKFWCDEGQQRTEILVLAGMAQPDSLLVV